MTKQKIFTLISGETVHISPQGRVIPAEDYSQALSAAELMERVEAQIAAYKADVAAECEKLKDQAQREGFEEGFAAWMDKVAELEQQIQQSSRATEKLILPVALQTARKIVGRELEISQTAIADIVATKLRAVSQHKRVTVFVNPREYEKVDKQRPKLKELFERLETFSIRPRDDVKPGGCIIETESGIINAQLDSQWDIIEQAFQIVAEKDK